jgi:hypothetical protein
MNYASPAKLLYVQGTSNVCFGIEEEEMRDESEKSRGQSSSIKLASSISGYDSFRSRTGSHS